MYATELKEFEEKVKVSCFTTNLPTKLKDRTNGYLHQCVFKTIVAGIGSSPCARSGIIDCTCKNLKIRGCFHYDRRFYYFRNLNDRVLLGGARNKAFELETTDGEMSTSSVIQTELGTFYPKLSFGVKRRKSRIGGQRIMAVGAEEFPIVKRVSKRITCAVRLSGIGVALAPESGKWLQKRK